MKQSIYALSTVFGKSGVAIVRISGPASAGVLKKLGYNKEPQAKQATLHKFLDPRNGDAIDEGLFIYFKAPASFTGEDILEIHTHGSIAVISHLLEVLSELPELRLAEPGEFSKSAFLNSKMDLTMAEGLADLIDAETYMQKKLALRQFGGELQSLYETWRLELIFILSRLEAFIDFPDDEIPQNEMTDCINRTALLKNAVKEHLQAGNKAEAILSGINICILGPVNAGKSTLLNWFANSDVAIVSDIPGTTRDIIQVRLDIDGFLVNFIDTAGLRPNTADVIEQEGIRRAMKAMTDADIRLIMLKGDSAEESIEFIKSNQKLFGPESICIINKTDIASKFNISSIGNILKDLGVTTIHCISVNKNQGLEEMLENLRSLIREKYTPSALPVITKIRYKKALEGCLESLELFSENLPLDIMAQEIRLAINSIASITGKVDVETILDTIFSTFCIGK